jgi:hypothetical protein
MEFDQKLPFIPKKKAFMGGFLIFEHQVFCCYVSFFRDKCLVEDGVPCLDILALVDEQEWRYHLSVLEDFHPLAGGMDL